MELQPRQVLNDRYHIIGLMGTGGMGAVYRAHDPVLDRPVAIKQLQPDPITGARPEQIRQQFLREAQSLAALHHPNLPRVTDYFTQGDQQYLVMDFIEGQSLQERLHAQPQGLPEAQVMAWADQLLLALEYIHQHRLIHRDIKPSNIRVTPDGRIFLVDFGLVKSTDTGNPHTLSLMRGVGTPEYAPPEQYEASSTHTDERSDVFALGATLYHLLSGKAPVTVSTRMSEPARFQAPRTHNARLSPEVERVILRAMELERAKRFASAADMRHALQLAASASGDASASTTQLARGLPPAPIGSSGPTARAKRWPLALIGVAGLVGVIVLIGALLPRGEEAGTRGASTAVLRANVQLTQLSGLGTPEFAIIHNAGNAPQNLTGWYMESVIGPQIYNFPAGYSLAPGESVRIESYTGAVDNPPRTLLWSVDPVWRNAGDKAILRNAAGAAISTQCYGDACP